MFNEGLRAPYGQPPLTPGRVRRPSSESIVSGLFDTQQMHAMAVMKEIRSMVCRMDVGTIKTQNSKCRLYWCLIEFMDWRYSSHVGIFDPFCELLLLYLSLTSHTPPSPSHSKRTVYTDSVAVGGGGGVELCCSKAVNREDKRSRR
jgi:hypothetical protein